MKKSMLLSVILGLGILSAIPKIETHISKEDIKFLIKASPIIISAYKIGENATRATYYYRNPYIPKNDDKPVKHAGKAIAYLIAGTAGTVALFKLDNLNTKI